MSYSFDEEITVANEGYEKSRFLSTTSAKQKVLTLLSQTIGIRAYGLYQKLEILKEELDGK